MKHKVLTVCLGALVLNVSATDPKKEYEQWLKSYKQEYNTFVDEYDKEFAEFLKTHWIKTDVIAPVERDNTPKPVDVPKAEPKPVADPKPVKVAPKVEPTNPQPKPIATPKPYDYAGNQPSINIEWMGLTLALPQMPVAQLDLTKLNGQTVADAWMTLAKTPFKPAVEALKKAHADLNLDDWGQAILTHKYVAAHGQLNANQVRAHSWFYLVKQGFDTRVSYKDQNFYLMMAVAQPLFGRKFFTLDDKRFYFVDLGSKASVEVGSVYTYDKQHSSAVNSYTIDFAKVPTQAKHDAKRTLVTKIGSREVSVTTEYNREFVEFLDYYPQLDMKYYFQAELPEPTRQELLGQLAKHIEGMSELEAINFLLHFVQKSLAYQTDDEQFNYENYLVAAETLHYPYADCEDRSVLFAYLVKNLLGNAVIGVQYDGHIATAVKVESAMTGDSYRVNGETYWVADPTYINANFGTVMPQFKGKSAKFVVY